MTCPRCGSEDIRSSHRTQWTDWFHRARHQSAWRCRKCRLRFHAHAEPGADPPRHARKRRERKRGSKALQRLIVQAIIGVILLFVFYVFLRYLTREPSANSDSGQLIVPPSHLGKPG